MGFILVHHIVGDRGVRRVQGDIIALGEDAVQITHDFDAVREILRRLVGVIAQDVHLERQSALRDAGTDVAAADDAEGLAAYGVLADLQFCLVVVVDPGLVQDGDVAAHFEDQHERSLSNGGAVRDRSIQGLYAVIVAGFHVKSVKAGAVAHDYLQVRVGLDHFAGDGSDADDHGIRLIFLEIGKHVFGFEAAAVDDGVTGILKKLAAFTHDFLR